MQIQRHFTTAGESPFSTMQFSSRASLLTRRDGSVVFQQGSVTVPEAWDQTSVDVLAQKYFRRRGCSHNHENSAYNSAFSQTWSTQIVSPTGVHPDHEFDLRQSIHRIVGNWTATGRDLDYFNRTLTGPEERTVITGFDADHAQAFYDELAYMMAKQMFAPASPQWFNTGLGWAYGLTGDLGGHYFTDYFGIKPSTKKSLDTHTRPMTGACFIQSISDDLVGSGGIMDLFAREARIFKAGGGSGTSYSNLRGKGEPLSAGGTSSGLISFLRVGDRAAGAIKSGGVTRRAARMVCLDMDHPDIEEFINWKMREERKVAMMVVGSKALHRAWANLTTSAKADPFGPDPKRNPQFATALREARHAGVPDGFLLEAMARIQQGVTEMPMADITVDWEGEGYDTISAQNANNSVRVPDAFMQAVTNDTSWSLTQRVDGKVVKTPQARALWRQVAMAAWSCADPGLQFSTTINFWHTCPEDGNINASNPCQPAQAPVLTPQGISTMGALQVGDIIWSGKQWTTVTHKVATGIKQVNRYHTRAGSFLGTAQHRVVSGGEKIEVAKADAIDACCGPTISSEDTLDPQAVLDGLLLGDGSCIYANNGQNLYAVLTIGGEDQDYFSSEVAHLIVTVPYDSKDTNARHRVATTLLPEELPHTYDRQVPDRFFYGNEKVVRSFLRGLYTANGSICGGRVTLKAASFPVVDRVQQMLSSLGITSYYTTNKAKDVEFANGVYTCKESYDLNITHGRSEFQRLIGFIHADKNKRLAEACARPSRNYTKPSYEVVAIDDLGEMPVFDITVAADEHTYWTGGLLVSNCSEFLFLDDTTCNLGSLNLVSFLREDGSFDLDGFIHATELMTKALDITVSMSQYPTKQIAENAHRFRTLGGGYTNLGGLLMRMGIPYDSSRGREIAAGLTAIMTGVAYRTSAQLAAKLGAFPGYAKNKDAVQRVLLNHHALVHGQVPTLGSPHPGIHYQPLRPGVMLGEVRLSHVAKAIWSEVIAEVEQHGLRNAQVTLLAPCGTIGILMDCDTTGVEPDFALVKFKKLAGGGYMKLVNRGVTPALDALGYTPAATAAIIAYISGTSIMGGRTAGISKDMLITAGGFSEGTLREWDEALITAFDPAMILPVDDLREKFGDDATDLFLLSVGGHGTIEGAPGLKLEHLPVFDCASRCGRGGTRSISPDGHLLMMAATQPFLSGAISKTINLPGDATIQQVQDTYFKAWSLGLKAVALYRDGSKLSQPLATSMELLEAVETIQDPRQSQTEKVVAVAEALLRKVVRRKLPSRRGGYTQAVKIGGTKIYLRTGEYEDGALGEIFLDSYKEGAGYRAILNSFAIAVSLGLQYGVPLEEFCDAFLFTKFEPNGPVQDHDMIKMCLSTLDFIFRDLAIAYLKRYDLAHVAPEDLIAESGVSRPVSKTLMPGSGPATHEGPEVSLSELQDAMAAPTPAPRKVLSPQEESRAKGCTGEPCPHCGHLTLVRSGTCNKCLTCGGTTGCS